MEAVGEREIKPSRVIPRTMTRALKAPVKANFLFLDKVSFVFIIILHNKLYCRTTSLHSFLRHILRRAERVQGQSAQKDDSH